MNAPMKTISYDDSPEAKERVWQICFKWFHNMDMFTGESLSQSDKTYEEAPNILAQIAEEGFKFKETWNDD